MHLQRQQAKALDRLGSHKPCAFRLLKLRQLWFGSVNRLAVLGVSLSAPSQQAASAHRSLPAAGSNGHDGGLKRETTSRSDRAVQSKTFPIKISIKRAGGHAQRSGWPQRWNRPSTTAGDRQPTIQMDPVAAGRRWCDLAVRVPRDQKTYKAHNDPSMPSKPLL
jgi:hypothetical protein